jgi:MFS family permease
VKKNIALLYGFSFFDQFMIVIALWVPDLATKGIGMRQFMELQAVFALVILCGELPSGVLSDLWGRKKTLLLGSTLKAASFSLLPLWSSYEGFLFYHFTMGIALRMISGGDVALLYDSYLAAGSGLCPRRDHVAPPLHAIPLYRAMNAPMIACAYLLRPR